VLEPLQQQTGKIKLQFSSPVIELLEQTNLWSDMLGVNTEKSGCYNTNLDLHWEFKLYFKPFKIEPLNPKGNKSEAVLKTITSPSNPAKITLMGAWYRFS